MAEMICGVDKEGSGGPSSPGRPWQAWVRLGFHPAHFGFPAAGTNTSFAIREIAFSPRTKNRR